jgi:hypothetical protein
MFYASLIPSIRATYSINLAINYDHCINVYSWATYYLIMYLPATFCRVLY